MPPPFSGFEDERMGGPQRQMLDTELQLRSSRQGEEEAENNGGAEINNNERGVKKLYIYTG